MRDFTAVINTCCLGPNATTVGSSGEGAPYAERYRNLITRIIPRYREWDIPVIIVGEFIPANEEFNEDWTYISSPSTYFGVEDAVDQRERACQHIKTEYAIFQHDDHLPCEMFPEQWEAQIKGADIYSPARWKMTDTGIHRLNNGEDDPPWINNADPYISGHFTIIKNPHKAQFLWASTPREFTWDIGFTKVARNAGMVLQWTRNLAIWDIE
jgi:hypothetical protein